MSGNSGLSGLNANAVFLRVIGNNLANLNTVGYKSSQVNFSDLVYQTIGGASNNPVSFGTSAQTLVESVSIVSNDAQFDAYGVTRIW